MGLYFAANPNELRGNILELGSGVGLGGILSNFATRLYDDDFGDNRRSVTLTDVNDDVLDMLQRNMDAAAESSRDRGNVCIQKLDWFDFLGDAARGAPPGTSCDRSTYDTIIASDCAYLSSQIAPLSETISKMLGNGGEDTLHMFAPYNRGVVHDLIDELHEKGMHVRVDDIELSKYRIKQGGCFGHSALPAIGGLGSGNRDDNMKCGVSKFLHIRAWHKSGAEMEEDARNVHHPMTDID